MKINFLRKIRLSIFVKLFIIMFITGFITFALIVLFMGSQFTKPMRLAIDRNIDNYLTYIAEDLGSPPDTLRAKLLSKKHAIHIQYLSDSLSWASFDVDSLSRHEQRFIPFSRRKKEINKLILHRDFVIQNEDGSRFLFNVNIQNFVKEHDRRLILLLGIIGLLFLGSFYLLRQLLKPIKLLTFGVRQVGDGNLEHKVPVMHKDELTELSSSFNEMTNKIKEMLKSRDQLLLDVSHELRSPLTRIRVALEFIPHGKHKESIEEDISDLEAMITEILETERLKQTHGRLEFKKHDISALVRNMAAEYKEKKPGIKISMLPEKMMIRFDYERMEIVIKNLLENAIKYSAPDSRPVEIFVEKGEKQTAIRIVDYGMGIPAEHLPYIFEPFYRVDKSRSKKSGGYGLGLSLCKRIMEYHEGSISIVQNKSVRGTTVELVFPL